MRLLLIILGIAATFSDYELNFGLSGLLKNTHAFCLNNTPKSSYKDFYAAIVCGSNEIANTRELYFLKTSGLYHLLVVSGSHLIFLAQLLELIFKQFKNQSLTLMLTKYSVLIFFGLTTGLEPPIFRSLISLTYYDLSQRRAYYWTSSEIALASLLTCLTLNSSWVSSFSLVLSHMASLALIIFASKKPHLKHIGIYFFTFIFLLPLQLPNPLSILTNLCLSGVVGFLLFPVSLVAFFIPQLTLISDPFWKALLLTLELVSEGSGVFEPYPISIICMWVLLLVLNGILIWRRI